MGSWLVGFDYSEYQEDITWSEVSPGGYFGIGKISEGTSYVDRKAAQNVPGARSIADSNGWLNFWYHFADGADPIAEANHFLATLNSFGGLQVYEGLAYDFEKNGIADPGQYANTFEEYVLSQVGVRPLLYSTRYLMSLIYQANPNAGKWLADPDDPPNTNAQYLGQTVPYEYIMQQYGTGNMPGVPTACDIDYFFGNLEQLKAYTKQPASPPVQTPPVVVPPSPPTTGIPAPIPAPTNPTGEPPVSTTIPAPTKTQKTQAITKYIPIVVAALAAVLNVLLGTKTLHLSASITDLLNGLLVTFLGGAVHINSL